jgi:drug/metabolite transporter (DMT)-like permease
MTLIISLLFLREKINVRKLIGLVMGMTGAATLLKLWTLDMNLFLMNNNILFIVCPAIWALLTICSQRAAATVSSYLFSFITFGLSTLFYLPFALNQGIWTVFEKDAIFWVNLIFLSIISGTLATTVYFVSAERLGSYMTSSYVFLVPTSALLLSWFFLGEVPEITTLTGGAITIAAVYLINRTE